MSAGWVIGWTVGGVIVVVVVVLLLLMIRGATRAGDRAEAILGALHQARDNTDAVWRVDETNRTTARITEAATAARRQLTTGGRRP